MALPAFRAAQHMGGGVPRVAHYTVAAAPTAFVVGDVVLMTAVDDIIDSIADDPAAVLGVALAGSAGNESKKIPVLEFTQGVIFSAAFKGAWAADQVGDVDAGIDLTTGTHSVEVAGNAPHFKLLGLDTTDDAPAGIRRVLVSVLGPTDLVAGTSQAADSSAAVA